MNEWYSPNKKKRKTARVVGAVILILAVLAAAIFIWAKNNVSFNFFSNNNGKTESFSFGKVPGGDGGADSDEDFPDDFKEFFDGFYTSTTKDSTTVSIPRYEGDLDFKLQLKKASGRELTLQELYDKCSPYIVSVSSSVDGKTDSYWGSGVVISEDGLILTNTHVIADCVSANIQLADGTQFEAKLVGADAVSDLAVLKIESPEKLQYAEFADISDLDEGDAVAAIGSPLGATFRNTLTDGIISAINRDLPYNGHSMTLLQTNTALNEGNSGGALFNMYGQVIGITNMKMMSALSSIEGIGFAIPSTTAETVVNQLVASGYIPRTYIGVTVGSIPENVAKNYNLPNGLYVSEVVEGSGAADAGMQIGDVITEVNGIEITSANEVNVIKDKMSVGDTLVFTVFRDGKTMKVKVVLKESVSESDPAPSQQKATSVN